MAVNLDCKSLPLLASSVARSAMVLARAKEVAVAGDAGTDDRGSVAWTEHNRVRRRWPWRRRQVPRTGGASPIRVRVRVRRRWRWRVRQAPTRAAA